MDGVIGYDPVHKVFVEKNFWSDGAHYTLTYDASQALKEQGTAEGIVTGVENGKDIQTKSKVERRGPTEWVYYATTNDGQPIEVVFRRRAAGSSDQSHGEKVFRAFADIAVGGKWVPLDDDGNNVETYEPIVDGKYLLHTAKRVGPYPSAVSIVGIDPDTKQCTFWDFSASGDVLTMTIDQDADGNFVITPIRPLPSSGPTIQMRLIKVDPDTVGFEMLECPVAGGEARKVFEGQLKRKR